RRHGDRQVGRSPDDVDDPEGGDELHASTVPAAYLSAQIQLQSLMMIQPNRLLGVELRHLAALEAVARTRSFGGAARELGYTQSAVSQQIAQLEKLVGQRLVERPGGPRRVDLPEAGRLPLRHADSIVAHP